MVRVHINGRRSFVCLLGFLAVWGVIACGTAQAKVPPFAGKSQVAAPAGE